jgi:hypothetical protein
MNVGPAEGTSDRTAGTTDARTRTAIRPALGGWLISIVVGGTLRAARKMRSDLGDSDHDPTPVVSCGFSSPNASSHPHSCREAQQ